MTSVLKRGLRGVAVVAGLAGLCACTGPRAGEAQAPEECTYCHGAADNFSGDNLRSAAPPRALEREYPTRVDQIDRTATGNPGVGAHQVHLREGALSRAVACGDCHVVPILDGEGYSNVLGHIGGTLSAPDATPGRADLTFAGRAVLGGVAADYDYDGYTCQTYCHGATLSGGAHPAPVWNKVGEGQADCGGCHGMPPTKAGHPQSTRCSACHPTVDADQNIIDKDRHIDGTVDRGSAACNACHGSDQNSAPPVDTQGRSDPTLTSVGAHQAHLVNGSIANAVACTECHTVPTDLGHVDGTAQVVFGALALTDGASPSWNGATCQSYCHGQTLGGGTNTAPAWTAGSSQAACGTCHGLPPAGDHPQDDRCYVCHPTTDVARAIVRKDLHLNGAVDVKGTECNSCHGSTVNNAPPVDTQGRSDPALTSVGAHQAHLVNGTYSDAIACAACHVVPTDLGHLDDTAQVVFGGPLAHARGFATPSWSGTTCSVYCHGAGVPGGSNTAPNWTGGSSQAECGTCHGLPPTGTHPTVGATSCADCHGAVVNADLTFKDKPLHINGVVEVDDWPTSQCDSCHDAPPHSGSHLKHYGGTVAQAAYGDTSATAANAAGATPSYIFGCGNCHPQDVAHHRNGVVDVELYNAAAPGSSLKARSPATASYTPGATPQFDSRGHVYTLGTCGDVYCHSRRTWTTPNGVPVPTTNASPPAGQFFWDGSYPIVYPQAVDSYVTATRVYKRVTWGAANPGCGGCHGNPPQTSTATGNAAGAGDSHAFIDGASQALHNRFSTVMGSGNVPCRGCHNQTVLTDPATIADARYHVNGQHEVAFDQANRYDVAGSNRSLVGATYDPVTRACGVSCHAAERTDLPRWGDPYRNTNLPECLRCHDGAIPN